MYVVFVKECLIFSVSLNCEEKVKENDFVTWIFPNYARMNWKNSREFILALSVLAKFGKIAVQTVPGLYRQVDCTDLLVHITLSTRCACGWCLWFDRIGGGQRHCAIYAFHGVVTCRQVDQLERAFDEFNIIVAIRSPYRHHEVHFTTSDAI